MAETTRKYYSELNIFRALVIIWVVIGHSFNQGLDFLGFLHYYAYTFHMPAFFVLSGLLFSKKVAAIDGIKTAGRTVLDRFKRLMIPFFFFTAVSYVLKFFLEDYANNELPENPLVATLTGRSNPNGGLWFLYALFVMSCLAILLYRLPSLLTLLIMLGLKITSLFVAIPYFGYVPLKHIYLYGVYFFFGVFFFRYYQSLSKTVTRLFQKKTLAVGGTVLLLTASFAVIRWIQTSGKPFTGAAFLLTVVNIIIWYLTAVACCSFTVTERVLTPVGNYGMDIYMIGYYVQITLRVVLLSMLGLPYVFGALMMCVCGLLLPIPISKYFVRRFRITRILVLGDFSKKEVKNDGKET